MSTTLEISVGTNPEFQVGAKLNFQFGPNLEVQVGLKRLKINELCNFVILSIHDV